MKHESPLSRPNMELNKIYNIDCLEGLRQLPDKFVQTCVTSPPYWGLRDYGVAGQHGLEESPESFISQQVEVFREVRRVLRNDGTLWVNIGDSYASNQRQRTPDQVTGGTITGKGHNLSCRNQINKVTDGIKRKDLVGIPWMLAIALRADGWYLRQDIIWHKPNPMPESVTDRCTKSHEYVFLLTKQPDYYFNSEAIDEPMAASSLNRLSQNIEGQHGSSRVPGKSNGPMKAVAKGNRKSFRGGGAYTNSASFLNSDKVPNGTIGNMPNEKGTRNKRSVWTIATQPFKEAHFATFPEEIPRTCILAGSPPGGIVLDPYMGAGTTALVAWKLQRQFIGFELNPEYVAIAERRLNRAKKIDHQTQLL